MGQKNNIVLLALHSQYLLQTAMDAQSLMAALWRAVFKQNLLEMQKVYISYVFTFSRRLKAN